MSIKKRQMSNGIIDPNPELTHYRQKRTDQQQFVGVVVAATDMCGKPTCTSRSSSKTSSLSSNPIPIPYSTIRNKHHGGATDDETKRNACGCEQQEEQYKVATWNMYHRIKQYRNTKIVANESHSSITQPSRQPVSSSSSSFVSPVRLQVKSLKSSHEPSSNSIPSFIYRNMTNDANTDFECNNNDARDDGNNNHNNDDMLWELEL